MFASAVRRRIRDMVASVDVSRWMAGTGETRLREALAPGEMVGGFALQHGTFIVTVESVEYGDRRTGSARRTARLMLMLFAEVRPTADEQMADHDAALDLCEVVRGALQRDIEDFTVGVLRIVSDGQSESVVMHTIEIEATYYGD